MGAVVLTTFSSRMEADIAVAKLADSGIRAWIQTDSANGFEPQWDFIRGVRVLTREEDLAEAADVLEVVPPPPLEPLSEEREQLVRTVRNLVFGLAALGLLMAAWDRLF
ncbi:MAG: hypothetical protein R3246_05875 [Acidimicrobiia bacterium]|nr:hypothetical protein [Acidimicrobiia bacterium]